MPRFCSSCGAPMAEGAVTCSSCAARAAQSVGGGTAVAPAATPSAGGLTDNVAGLLAYITIIPSIIFLVMEPYNRNRFVRFHSFQNIFFCVACIALSIVMSIIGMVPMVGLITLFVWPLLGLGLVVVWVILLLKAYQGQMFKLPFIGDLAEKQANA
jgi:uncharacterized membrane protein